ncbi:sarcosine oxidase subunit gamma [Mesorhizobium sp. CAU 1732]|uniref:sarcosine oxidase subunit gamma n=1 Tax=Mesorhizobium sp. CAU 1732 TaxID=3140358 RepID=UPI003260A7B3
MAKSMTKAAQSAASTISRKGPLDGRSASGTGVTVALAAPAHRMSLRAPEAGVAALSKALGVTLPLKPKTSAEKAGRAALWLGPDEWLVIDQAGNDPVAARAGVKTFHSAVDVSHRNVGILVSGPGAEATISAGCPQDLSIGVFPVGACSRTVLGKIEIVVWRTGETEFRVECWRSFSDYAFAFLADAARDAAA